MPKIEYDGFNYELKSKYKETQYYRCAKFNGRKCEAKIKVIGEEVFHNGKKHNCLQTKSALNSLPDKTLNDIIGNYAKTTSLSSSQIYSKLIVGNPNEKNTNAIILPTKNAVRKIVSSFRSVRVDSISGMFEKESAKTIDGFPFLQTYKKSIVAGKVQELVVWASSEGLCVLRQQNQIFVDGTFRVVPREFCQCLVIVSFDKSAGLYVPCIWALMTSRTETMYWLLFQEIIGLLDWK